MYPSAIPMREPKLRTSMHVMLIVCGLGLMAYLAPTTSAQDSAQAPANAAQENPLASGQGQLATRFKKLEGILLRSAEIEAVSNPTRAALMRQAAALAKQVQLSDSLVRAARSLEQKQYSQAIEDQKASLENLNKILELLQSENRSDRVREQKEQVRRTIEETERLLRLESSLRGRTEGGAQTEKAASDQQKLAEKAGQIAKDLSPEQAEAKDSEGKPKTDSQEANSKDKKSNDKDSDKEKADKDNTDQEKADKDKADQEKADKDKADKDKADREKADKDRANKEKADKDKADKDGQSPAGKDSDKPSSDSDGDKKNGDDQKPAENQPSSDQPSGQPKQSPSKPSKPNDGQQSQPAEDSQQSDDQQSESGESEPEPKDPVDRATKRLKKAQKNMQEAQKNLEKGDRKDAVEKQRQAEQELKSAIEELEEILRQLREEEIERSLSALEERLRLMLQLQNKVLDESKRLQEISAGGNDRQVEIRANSLSSDEKKILGEAQRALLLLREEGTSAAFPESLSHIISDMQKVVERLSKADVGKLTIGIEEDIVSSLEELVAAMSEIKKENKERKDQQAQAPGGQAGQPGEQPLVNQLAEMRLIKTLQLRINKRTQTLSQALKDPNDAVGQVEADDIQNQLRELADRQSSIKQVTRDIVIGKNKQ